MTGLNPFPAVLKCAAVSTLGSLLIAYGLKDVLWTAGGELYHVQGIGLIFMGWLILLISFVGLYREMQQLTVTSVDSSNGQSPAWK